jgi:DNA-binding transcriptional MerR regulator
MKTRYQLKPPMGRTGYVSKDEAARFSGMHPKITEAFMRACIVPSKNNENEVCEFSPEGIERLRLIQRVRNNRRQILRNIHLVLSLTDELEETKRELESLRSKVHSQLVAGFTHELGCAGFIRPRLEGRQYDPEILVCHSGTE